MAKIIRLNPPPNWPAPPADWTPPPNWQPNPAWGPPPQGWQLWVKVRANPGAGAYASGSAVALYVFCLCLLLIVSRGGFGAEGAGELIGPFLIGGVVVGLVARSATTHWPLWLYPLFVFVIALALRMFSVFGQQLSNR